MANDTYRTITPYLLISDAEAEIRFLQTAFGAKLALCERRPDGSVAHAELEIGDSKVMLGQAVGEWKPRQAALYLWLSDVDAVYARALHAGATSEAAPEDKPYGHRSGAVVDPAGQTWWIASPVRTK